MSTILIRQLPDDYSGATGLAKHNRSRMPGTTDVFSAAINTDDRFLTNIDEESFLVPHIKKEDVKALRENLERKLGQDLTGKSSFWRTFEVRILSDKPKIFNTENPLDLLSFNMLLANRYIAPSKEAASTPEYKDSQYYAYTEEGEITEEVSIRKQRDRAIGALLTISENKEKMLLYGSYLEGLKYTNKLGTETLYKMLRAYIDAKEIKNSLNFLNILKEPLENIQAKTIVDKAVKQRLISRTNIGNKKYVYQYGQITVGSNLEDVYKNMVLPDFAPEFVAIKKELEDK